MLTWMTEIVIGCSLSDLSFVLALIATSVSVFLKYFPFLKETIFFQQTLGRFSMAPIAVTMFFFPEIARFL